MKKSEGNKLKIDDFKTFTVPFSLEEIKGNAFITKTFENLSKLQITQKAFNFHSQGNILEATKYYQQLINEGCNDHRVFFNYGAILMGLGKLKEAELSYRKAIEIKPDFANAYFNLFRHYEQINNLEKIL